MAKRYSTTKVAPSDIPSSGKYTRYNRETMDYDAFFDGQYLGSRESMDEVRDLVNEHVYDLERSGMMYTATQLDAGSSVEEIAADVESAPIPPSAPAVAVEYLYYDATHPLRDLTEEARGPLAYTTYVCGCGDEQADIAFKMDGSAGPEISLFNDDPRPLATVLAAVANLQMLLADPRVHAALYGITPPAAPAVTAQPFICDDDLSEDYNQPIGLSYCCNGAEVYVPHAADQPVQLVLPTTIYGRLDVVRIALTPHDLDEPYLPPAARAALPILLSDPRVLAVLKEQPQPPTPAAPAVALIDHGDDWIEYRAGRTALSIEDGVPACFLAFETSHDLNPERRQDVRDLFTLLSDTRVQTWIHQPEAMPQRLAA